VVDANRDDAKGSRMTKRQVRVPRCEYCGRDERLGTHAPVSVTDRDGMEVVHADITTWVTPAV
jgi:hypothetical protein